MTEATRAMALIGTRKINSQRYPTFGDYREMRSAMRTAARTGTKYVVERADTSIFLRGSECQLGLLRALDLAPHGQSRGRSLAGGKCRF